MANFAGLQPADFTAAVMRLLPRGYAWNLYVGSVLRSFWTVIAGAIAAVHARAGVLTETEAWPPTSVELLPDWEAVFGLPDPCLGANPTIAARQAAVAERLAASGGQSIPYFEGLAAQLGATISTIEYAPFRLGINAFTQPLYTAEWAYVWTVEISGTSLHFFGLGVDSFASPFWQLNSNAVQCEIQRLAPAHTQPLFTILR